VESFFFCSGAFGCSYLYATKIVLIRRLPSSFHCHGMLQLDATPSSPTNATQASAWVFYVSTPFNVQHGTQNMALPGYSSTPFDAHARDTRTCLITPSSLSHTPRLTSAPSPPAIILSTCAVDGFKFSNSRPNRRNRLTQTAWTSVPVVLLRQGG